MSTRTLHPATTAEAYLELLKDRGIDIFLGNAGTDFASAFTSAAGGGKPSLTDGSGGGAGACASTFGASSTSGAAFEMTSGADAGSEGGAAGRVSPAVASRSPMRKR